MYNYKQDTAEARENPIHRLKRKIERMTAVVRAASDWEADGNQTTRRALKAAVRALRELEQSE